MNDYHSAAELNYKTRLIAGKVRQAVKAHPVVVLSGARQVGKSTLLQNEKPFNEWTYITLDDYNSLEQAQKSPDSLWANSTNIIIDEVQKVPKILPAIKEAVDKSQRKIRFILSGSANLLLMQSVSESLAGRAVYLTLYPMTLGEAQGIVVENVIKLLLDGKILNTRVDNSVRPEDEIIKGQLPLTRLFNQNDRLDWLDGYIATYLERDLRQLTQIESLPDFRRVMGAIALRSGQLLNQTEIAKDTKVSQPTVYRYINLLETTSLLSRLPAFANNRTKRLIKSPKFYWTDSSLAAFLCGHFDIDSLKNSKEIGSLFETLIFLHLKVFCEMISPMPRIYYWRTTTGREVDFVIEHGKKLLAFEVKLTNRPSFSDIDNLRIFLKDYPETVLGVLIHTGQEIKYLDKNIIAVPWTVIAGLGSSSQ